MDADETLLAVVELNERGRGLADEGDLDGAAQCYREAIDRLPSFEPAWFNLGLVHKARREWAAAADCNLRAAELGGEEGDPAWWNLGIAATGLRDWQLARRAWTGFGLEFEQQEGEIRADYGPAPIRLNPDTTGEVVWCWRIDPARAVVQSIPLPGSGHRWRDVVLHDGAPRGERALGEDIYGVFDELERWEPSDVPTLEVEVVAPQPQDAEELQELFEKAGLAAEDWSAGVRALCRRCSEGRPFEDHEHPGVEIGPERRFGLSAGLREAEELLRQWAAGADGRRHGSPQLVG